MADLTQLRDYNKCIDRSVEVGLTKLMEGLTCGVSVDEYIGADDDEPIQCDSDTIQREAVENDSDGDSTDEVSIALSEALECCLRLSTSLSLQHDNDKLTKKLASITEHVESSARWERLSVIWVHLLKWVQTDPHIIDVIEGNEANAPHTLVCYKEGRL